MISKILMAGLVYFLAACSLEVNISNDDPSSKVIEIPTEQLPSIEQRERVQTTLGTPGYQLEVVIGEVGETRKTSNGWRFENPRFR